MTAHSSTGAILAWHLREINICLTYFQREVFLSFMKTSLFIEAWAQSMCEHPARWTGIQERLDPLLLLWEQTDLLCTCGTKKIIKNSAWKWPQDTFWGEELKGTNTKAQSHLSSIPTDSPASGHSESLNAHYLTCHTQAPAKFQGLFPTLFLTQPTQASLY